MASKISNWNFLFGKWESVPETHVGEPEGSLTYAQIEPFPSDKYINMKTTTEVNGKFVSHGLSITYYDDASENYKQKSFFGMGFIVNYNAIEHNDTSIVFEAVSVESQPPDFGDSEFRYTLSKKSDSLIDLHLEMKPSGA